MMVHVPGVTDKGIVTEELTEFVDLFPTLVEAAGLPPLTTCPENSTNVKVCGSLPWSTGGLLGIDQM